MDKAFYLNPNIKKIGLTEEYSKEQVEEYIKCSKDPVYFIENYVKIISLDKGLVLFKLRGYQKKLIQGYFDNDKVTVLSSRQSGKTSTTVAFILWYVLFNSDKTVGILANKGSTAREILARLYTSLENIPFFLQPGVKALNKGSVEFGNNTRIISSATSDSALRGSSINFLYLDEFAHVPNADEFFKSMFPTISSGETTKIVISSTPCGLNLFHKIWKDAVEHRSAFIPIEVAWHEVPGRDELWKEKQIEVLGEHGFRQEYGNEFLGSANTLIAGYKLQELAWEPPINFDSKTVVLENKKEDHNYVAVVDVSKGVNADYSTVTIIDITEVPYKTVSTFRDNQIRPMVFPQLIVGMAKQYNEAYILVERNSMGQGVVDSIFYDYDYENVFSTANFGRRGQVLSVGASNKFMLGVEMTKNVKRIGSSTLKALVEENKLINFTSDQVLELYNFVAVADSFQADSGKNDDLVMNLVLFAWAINQDYYQDLTNSNIHREFNPIDEEDYDLLPPVVLQRDISDVGQTDSSWLFNK